MVTIGVGWGYLGKVVQHFLGVSGGGAFHWTEFCSVYLVGGEFFAGDGCLVSSGAAFPWSKLVISVGRGVDRFCVCWGW